MTKKNNKNLSEHNINDLEIIDLDFEPIDSLNNVAKKQETDEKLKPTDESSVFDTDSFNPYSFVSDTEQSDFEPNDQRIQDFEEPEDFSEPEEDAGKKKSFSPSVILHLLFFAILILIVFLIVNAVRNYGRKDSLDNYEGNFEPEVLDSILPLIPKDGAEVIDDGVTTIVAFGNAPFADDKDSQDSLANLIEDMTGATIYNCAVQDSYLAAEGATLSKDVAPMDAFNFYWLTTAFCLRNNDYVYQDIFEHLGNDLPKDGLEAYETLMSIDFNTVDVITIMYDGSDYLDGRYMYNDQNDTDIQQFTGNMCAGIDLIKATYPHIRIIVMSPTYAFAINEAGEYVSSDQYRYGQDVLSTYVIKQFGYAYDREVTFVDNLYGTISEDNASEYLTDNIHLNVEGRKQVAERFVYALNYYEDME